MLYLFGTFTFFLLGSVIGSFLNVVIYRLDWKTGLSGRSQCPHCKHTLGIKDLFPIFSYLLLAGKCRYCQKPISPQYPLVETVTAVIFASSFFFLPATDNLFSDYLKLIFYFFFFSVLIVLSVLDLKKGIIPDKIVLPAILIAFIYLIVINLSRSDQVFEILRLTAIDFATAFGIGFFFFLLILVTKGKGMGGGDFKLSILIGLALGFPLAIVGVILGFLTGAIAAVMLILTGKKGIKQTIPFGPFLAFGAYLSVLFGRELLGVYLKTLGL